MVIKIKKTNEEAKIPTQATYGDAGYDLYSLEDAWLRPHERKLFKVGISFEIPIGYYGRIAPRSGLAYKQGIDTLAGVIDSGFRSEVGVILYNTNGGDETNSVQIKKGQAIAQIIFENCAQVSFQLEDKLSESERGEKGYGSSDKRS